MARRSLLVDFDENLGERPKAANSGDVHLHPVIDQVVRPHPIDPLLVIAYVVLFVGAALAGLYRPVYGVAALAAVQPFALYSDVFHTTITLSKVVMLGLALGLAFRPGALRYLRELPARRFILAGLFVAATTALTFVAALHHGPVLRETAKALEYVMIFAVAYCGYRADRNVALIRAVLTYTILVVVLGALAQEIIGAPSGLYIHNHPIPRIAGPLEGPNQLAGYLDIALAVLLAFAIESPRSSAVIALTLAIAADILTFSRGGYVGAAVTIFAVIFVYRRVPKLVLFGMAAGIGLGAAIMGAWEIGAREAPKVGGYANSGAAVLRVEGLSKSSYAGGVGSRSELWHAALRPRKAHPLLGVGAGNYELDLPQAGLQGVRTHSNSLYVQALVEGGIPLILAVLWLTYISVSSFARKATRSPLIVAAFCGSIGLAVHQIGDLLTFYPKVGGWWWVVLALGAAEVSATTGGQTNDGAQEKAHAVSDR